MKKKLLLALATLMCISLCACGGSENTNVENSNTQNNDTQNEETNNSSNDETKFVLVGEWANVKNGRIYVFNEDSTGAVKYDEGDYEFKYEYKKDLEIVTIYGKGDTMSFNVVNENGIYKLVSDIELVPIDNYEPLPTVNDIDKDNLEQYYDTTQFVGNPTLCYGIYYKFNNGASFESFSPEGMGLGSTNIEPREDLEDSHKYYCIMTDNNTPDDTNDDLVAYIFNILVN